MVEVMLVLGKPTYPPQNNILVEIGFMVGFRHITVSEKYTPWINHSMRIIQLLIRVVLTLVLVMEMLKVVWVIGPKTLTPRKFIVVLMVVIFVLSMSR